MAEEKKEFEQQLCDLYNGQAVLNKRLERAEKQLESVMLVINIVCLATLVYVAWPTIEKTLFPGKVVEAQPPAATE